MCVLSVCLVCVCVCAISVRVCADSGPAAAVSNGGCTSAPVSLSLDDGAGVQEGDCGGGREQ